MISILRSLGLVRPCLPALLFLCLTPADASAEALRFRNDTMSTVVVQSVYVVRNLVRPGPTWKLGPGDMTPPFVLPGNKIITIYDDPRINGTRILRQATFPAGTADLFLSIVPDLQPPQVKLVTIPPK
jgi:hypothetical protein